MGSAVGDSTQADADTDVPTNDLGTVLIDASGGGSAPTLELKTATIDNGTVTTWSAGATSGSDHPACHDDGHSPIPAPFWNRPADAPR